jgi:hypothetical protein
MSVALLFCGDVFLGKFVGMTVSIQQHCRAFIFIKSAVQFEREEEAWT